MPYRDGKWEGVLVKIVCSGREDTKHEFATRPMAEEKLVVLNEIYYVLRIEQQSGANFVTAYCASTDPDREGGM